MPRRRSTRAPAAAPAPAPPPSLPRDPWAWLVLLAVVPLVLRSLVAPLGEPFADDFDYLNRALLVRRGGWLDGYGSTLYWRPLGRQLYFGLLSPLILDHPVVVPLLHVALLAVAGLLVYRALRPAWPAPWAACAGSFIALSESTRMLIAWASHFMDLGAIVFAALAIHAASRRRGGVSAAALLGSLLTKEVGVLAGLLLPWAPATALPRPSRTRRALVLAGVIAAWGAVYVSVCARAGLAVPNLHGGGPATPGAIPARAAWAMWNSLRAAFSLAATPGRRDGLIALGLGAIAIVGAARLATDARSRARFRSTLPWTLFGLAWFALATVPLIQVYPAWAPYRSAFGAMGLGIALAGSLGAIHPGLLVLLVAVRLAGLGFAAAPERRVTVDPADAGAAFDFPRLTRLERLTREMRDLLRSRHPKLPPHSVIALENLPRLTEYAFSGNLAIRTWYRDSTLSMVRLQSMSARELAGAVTLVEYSDEDAHPFSIVNPAAMLEFTRAVDALRAGEWAAARSGLERARALQQGEVASGFESAVLGMEAQARFEQGEPDSAAVTARHALARSRSALQARWVLVRVALSQRRRAEAEAQLDSLIALNPGEPTALELRRRLRAPPPAGPGAGPALPPSGGP